MLIKSDAAIALQLKHLSISTHRSVTMSCAVILRADHQTSALLGAAEHGLEDVDELLLVIKNPVQLVIVTGSEIAHDVLVAEEEHDGARVVQLVHGVEIGDLRPRLEPALARILLTTGETHLVDVTKVDGGEILDTVGYLVQHFILPHAVLLGVSFCVRVVQE